MDKGLEQLTDEQLVRKVRTQRCEVSLQELFMRHSGLCYSLAKRYTSRFSSFSGNAYQDVIDQRLSLVYEAAKDFDPTFGTKFSTHLGNKIKYFCLNRMNEEYPYIHLEAETIDFLMGKNAECHVINFKDEADYILRILNQLKDSRIKQIFILRYFSEKKKSRSWAHIGKKLKMSHQGVIDLHNQTVKFLRHKIANKNSCDFI